MVRRPANGAGQQMGDVVLENLVLWQTDCVQEALGFEVVVNLRRGERSVTAKIELNFPFLVAVHHWFQDIPPSVRTVYVAGT